MHLYLIGFMGAGKSTVGPLLADRLNRPFVDLDARIVSRLKPIPAIFSEEGEAGFRRHELETLRIVIQEESRAVIALGGGAPTHPETADLIGRTGRSIYLECRPETLQQRTAGDENRPLLSGRSPGERLKAITTLLDERRPVYESADAIVDANDRQPAELADRIVALL